MSYGTVNLAVTLYGEAQIAVGCDRDQDGVRDPGVFEAFLDLATNEIDGYLVGREILPLDPVPPQIAMYCIDIAIYRSRPTADLLTEEVKDRYRAAIRYLEYVQKNKIRLVVPRINVDTLVETREGLINSAVQAESVAIDCISTDRRFTRGRMRGI